MKPKRRNVHTGNIVHPASSDGADDIFDEAFSAEGLMILLGVKAG